MPKTSHRNLLLSETALKSHRELPRQGKHRYKCSPCKGDHDTQGQCRVNSKTACLAPTGRALWRMCASWMLRLPRAMHSCVDTRKILQRSCGCLLSVGADSPRGAGIRNTTCSSRSGGLAMKTGPLRSRLFIRRRRISDDCFGFAEVHLQVQRASAIRRRCIVSYRRNCLSRSSGIHRRR